MAGLVTGNPIQALKTTTEVTKYLNENPFTISVGVQLSGAGGLGASGSYSLGIDSKGNLVLQHSLNLGGGTPSAGASIFLAVTNAPSYKILESDPKEEDIPALVSGGSYSGGLSVGNDYTYIVADEGVYSGHTVSAGVGIGVSIPAELHSEISFTWTDKVIIEGVE